MTNFNFQPAPPLSEIVRMVEPCLVHIATPAGSGSGFVIDERGHIITNAHVVKEKGVSVKVEFVDGSEIPGIVVGIDEEVDLAYVRLAGSSPTGRYFACLSLGDSDGVSVGEDVLAMGYPLGEILKGSPTVTRGIISAKRPGQLQTDAAINPGNSGGPLINAYGNVIGVNTSSIGHIGGESITGINFAISINVVKTSLHFLASGGEIRKASTSDPDDSTGDEWVIHHVGGGGFSIIMPPWWTLDHTGDKFALFSSDVAVSSFLLSVLDAGPSEVELKNFARFVRSKETGELKDSWRAHATLLRKNPRGSQWSFDYRQDQYNSLPTKGKVVISLIKSRTGSFHYQVARLITLEGSTEDGFGLEKFVQLLLDGFVKWDTYGSGQLGWSISAAPGWSLQKPEDYSDNRLTLWGPNGIPAYLSVDICDLDDYVAVDELCRGELAGFLSVQKAWDRFEIISAHKDDLGKHEWYRINCRYQGTDDLRPSLVILQVGRSGLLEYVIVATAFERDVPDCIAAIDGMLASFQF